MKVIFLGTNGWYSTSHANTSCILIKTDNFYLVLDAGDGLYKLDKYIDDDKPIYIFLSHLHLDHIIGFHILNKFRFKKPLEIFGYIGTKKGLYTLLRHPFTASIEELPFSLKIHEINEGSHDIPFPFTSLLLIHADPCIGYRFILENKIITYCTDTGECDNLYLLANNADLFISECSYKPGQVEWEWPHLNPKIAAKIAKKSNVKQLILTHFDAELYNTLKSRLEAEIQARQVFPATNIARDGLELEF
ncbi:MAG: MBL fold metallo-hydrolase [Promethearchaeota archaeon]